MTEDSAAKALTNVPSGHARSLRAAHFVGVHDNLAVAVCANSTNASGARRMSGCCIVGVWR